MLIKCTHPAFSNAPLSRDDIHPCIVAARLDAVRLGDDTNGALALGIHLTSHGQHTLVVQTRIKEEVKTPINIKKKNEVC